MGFRRKESRWVIVKETSKKTPGFTVVVRVPTGYAPDAESVTKRTKGITWPRVDDCTKELARNHMEVSCEKLRPYFRNLAKQALSNKLALKDPPGTWLLPAGFDVQFDEVWQQIMQDQAAAVNRRLDAVLINAALQAQQQAQDWQVLANQATTYTVQIADADTPAAPADWTAVANFNRNLVLA